MMGEEMMGGKKPAKEKVNPGTDMQKEVHLEVPEGFEVPEGVKAGDSFEAMSTYRLRKDGHICLEAVEGNPLPGEKGETASEEEAEGSEEEGEYGPKGEAPEKGKGGPAMGFLLAIEKGAAKKKGK